MQHSGAMAVPEWATPAHIVAQEGGGAEATAFGGGKGGNLKGVQRLWAPPWDGDFLQIPRESDTGSIWRLSGSDPESGEGAGGVEEGDEDP